jgi:hypothetical protein
MPGSSMFWLIYTVILGVIMGLTALALYAPRPMYKYFDIRILCGGFFTLAGLLDASAALVAIRRHSVVWISGLLGWQTWMGPWQALIGGILCFGLGLGLLKLGSRGPEK